MEGPDQINPCAICLGGMGAGGGQAIFTAECSHTFHFHCISASVAHGHLVCPLCNAQWRELPFVRPASVPPTQPLPQPPPVHVVLPPQPRRLTTQPVDPVVFDDDEQVGPTSGTPDIQRPAGAASNGAVVVKTHSEYPAIARDLSHDNFAVLVHVKAPGITDTEAAGGAPPRAPVDLVTVLDVSGSMRGNKLALLKQAMWFVISMLGPDDRLCVVSFSSRARRMNRLTRMSDAGKALCVSAVESLTAHTGTNIAEGLRTAAKVLDERRYRNDVSSVVLLSDGQDNYTTMRRAFGREAPDYEALVPPSFVRTGTGDRTTPIHTFGFGNDHDAVAMHVISEATGGTFSFIENEAVIQDAFAQCIGGLLSVVVQEARLAIACVHPGVRLSSVRSGLYESRVDEDGRAASVVVGELYADEERRFLLFLAVPGAEETDGDTTLMKVTCSYRDTATGADVNVMAEDTVVVRPEHVVDVGRVAEVEREHIRVEATEDIAAARAAAELGAHQEAVEILENRRRAVARSEVARGGDPMIVALEIELRDMRGRVSNRRSYARSGRASMLAGMSAHMQQRASSSQLQLPQGSVIGFGGEATVDAQQQVSRQAATVPYATPAMLAMLLRSRREREAAAESGQQQPVAGEESEGSEPKIPRRKEMNQVLQMHECIMRDLLS